MSVSLPLFVVGESCSTYESADAPKSSQYAVAKLFPASGTASLNVAPVDEIGTVRSIRLVNAIIEDGTRKASATIDVRGLRIGHRVSQVERISLGLQSLFFSIPLFLFYSLDVSILWVAFGALQQASHLLGHQDH